MKYLNCTLILFLVSSKLFGYQVGTNSVGGQLGFATSEFDLDYGSLGGSLDGDLSGFAFELSGNFNAFTKNAFGLDLYANFSASPSLSDTINSTKIETALYNLDASLRPFFRSGIFSPFAIIGISHSSFEIEEEGFSGWQKGTKVSPTLGFGASLQFTDSLVLSPSFLWKRIEIPSISDSYSLDLGSTNSFRFDFPLTYKVSEHFTFGAVLSHTNYSEVDTSSYQISGTTVSLTESIKLSYWITSFMVKGDYVF